MIKDKELGLKLAENEYDKVRHNIEKQIEQEKLSLELNNVLLEYLKKKDGKNTK